jgi:hypothetical protein
MNTALDNMPGMSGDGGYYQKSPTKNPQEPLDSFDHAQMKC